MSRFHLRQLGWLLALGLAGSPWVTHAAHVPFPTERVTYELQRETLKGFLQRFFDDLGIPAVLSEEVQQTPGTLNGPRTGKAADVFKRIAESNGLVAYYDGSVVYIYKSRELSSRYFQIDPARAQAFRDATIGFGLTDGYDSLRLNADTGLVTASGTPRFLNQLTELTTALGRHVEPQRGHSTLTGASRMTLLFLPLKYAWAADTAFNVGNQRTIVPGIATILKQLVTHGEGTVVTVGGSTGGSAAINGLRGQGLGGKMSGSPANSVGALLATAASAGLPNAGSPPAATPASPEDVPAGPAAKQSPFDELMDGGETPRIVADSYRNAVLIRDYPERMPLYRQLVKQLDVESPIIGLDATVIDVDQTRALQLGINWDFQHGNTAVGFASGVQPVDSAGKLAGLMVNSIISNTSLFISQINALETQGVTKIVERPQVTTLNDVEAVIESTQSVYVPVSGAFDEDLYGVVAGTVLRVTPHIINDDGHTRIRLLVTVEDGSLQLTSQSVQTNTGSAATQSVPVVNRNAVNTQAIIDAGQGLLLGGLVRHEDTHTKNQVPLLGSIPLLGHLFRGETVKHEVTERLFLISPQIVTAGPAMPVPH